MAKQKIGVFYCKRIKDVVCVGCSKCFKAMSLLEGEYSRYDEPPEVVFMTHYGDCPGLIMPSAALANSSSAGASSLRLPWWWWSSRSSW